MVNKYISSRKYKGPQKNVLTSAGNLLKLFREYGLLEFIREGYSWLSETGYDYVVIELEEYLKRQGVALNIEKA